MKKKHKEIQVKEASLQRVFNNDARIWWWDTSCYYSSRKKKRTGIAWERSEHVVDKGKWKYVDSFSYSVERQEWMTQDPRKQ